MITGSRSRKFGILTGGIFGLAMLGAAVAPTAFAASSAASATAAIPTCDGLAVTIQVTAGVTQFDTAGADVIQGAVVRDVIYGLDGNDHVCGLGGHGCKALVGVAP